MAVPAPPGTTAYPPAPRRGEQETQFVIKANAFVAAMDPRRIELDDLGQYVYERAVDVEAQNNSAVQAAADAEESAQAAQGAARVYDNTTQGLAATSDGQYFTVPSTNQGGYLDLYKNDAGVAVYQNTSASEDVMAIHEAKQDPHSQYTTDDEAAAIAEDNSVVFALALG